MLYAQRTRNLVERPSEVIVDAKAEEGDEGEAEGSRRIII